MSQADLVGFRRTMKISTNRLKDARNDEIRLRLETRRSPPVLLLYVDYDDIIVSALRRPGLDGSKKIQSSSSPTVAPGRADRTGSRRLQIGHARNRVPRHVMS